MSVTDETRAAGRFIGQRIERREDPRLLTGHGTYVDDIRLPGMLHATFVRSPLAHATITSIDTTQAELVPGVAGVFTAEQINGDVTGPLWTYGPDFPPIPTLATGTVKCVGDPVVLVVAESRYIAEDAAELVDVVYEPLPAVTGREQAVANPTRVHAELESNLAWTAASPEDPALDAALKGSAHVVTDTIHQHRHLAVPMEGRGIVAFFEGGSDELTAHVASQGPHRDREYFAQVLGLPESKVRVIMRDVGGGFGQKIFRSRDETAVVLAARRLGVPVKWIEDRQENLGGGPSSRDEQMTVTIGVDDDGVLQGIRTDYLGDLGAYPQMPPMAGMMPATVFPGPYKLSHYGWSASSVYTNTAGLSPYRGPWLMETVAREIMMDITARAIGMDPAELRRRNLISAADLPYTTATGSTYVQITPLEAFEAALKLADYDGFRKRQAKALTEGRHLGIGISTYIEPTAGPYGPSSTEVAIIRVQPSGSVSVHMGTGSHGHSLETTMVQVVADHLGVPIEDVRLDQGDTASSPYGGGTAGSRSAVMAGNAARLGAVRMRDKVFQLAGHMLEAAPEDLEIERGVISVKGSPDSTITFAEVAYAAYYTPNEFPEDIEPGLEVTARYRASEPTHANSTQVCVVEVDTDTGQVEILDFVVGGDCGVMINPNVVEGQVAGGVVQGIAGVLLEHQPYDDAGNPLAITFKDYLLPTAANVPDLRYVHLETPSPNPGGHKGVGEGGAIGAGAAVVNAVADALAPLGVRVTEQPLTPDRVLAMIDAAAA